MDSSMVKRMSYAFYLFLGFQVFISKEPRAGLEVAETWWGKVWGIWKMKYDLEAKGSEGSLGHLRGVGCGVVVKEARPETRRRPSGKFAQLLHQGVQSAAVSVRTDSSI